MLVCIALAGLVFAISAPRLATAQTSPCDPEYMDALEARAWLEAQREIAQNQNLIYKPDSVLEYTCFDRFVNAAAANYGSARPFSETNRWDGWPVGFSATSTDEALTSAVLFPMQRYLDANFNRVGGYNAGSFLNNRTPPDLDYEYQLAIDGNIAYNCNRMAFVWQAARCANFDSEVGFDGFYDFAWYETNDPRREERPWALMCEADPRVAAARISAFNERQDLFNVGGTEITAAQGNGTPYQEDNVVTHLNAILPGNCAEAAPIPTGISVQRSDLNRGRPYPERVCPKPGCTNTPNTTTCTP